eukprot:6149981-Lingulodinium_polyedra.AAC.1
MALKASNLWWAVLLSSIPFNLPFGPWEGTVWFGKLTEGVQELLDLEAGKGGPLFEVFYEFLCSDQGAKPSHDPAYKA